MDLVNEIGHVLGSKVQAIICNSAENIEICCFCDRFPVIIHRVTNHFYLYSTLFENNYVKESKCLKLSIFNLAKIIAIRSQQ